MTADFSLETVQVRRQWYNIFKVKDVKNKTKPKTSSIYNSIPSENIFQNKGKIKFFSKIKKLK